MFDRKVLKSRAKFVLSRSFFMSVLACAIVGIVSGGTTGFSVQKLQNVDIATMSDMRVLAIYSVAGAAVLLGILISIFVASPLRVGLKHYMLRASDMEVNLENLMYPFRTNYRNIILVTFVRNLYVFLWMLLGLVPIIVGCWKFGLVEKILTLLPQVRGGSFEAAMSLMTVSSIVLYLTLIFMIPAMIKEYQYFLVDYILAENPDIHCHEAIRKSKDMMVGNKWPLAKLVFSFLGWYFLANATTCCVGNLLLNPYMEATYAQMYLEISGQGKDYSGYNFQNPFDGYGNM